jgi:hypothetical protein
MLASSIWVLCGSVRVVIAEHGCGAGPGCLGVVARGQDRR